MAGGRRACTHRFCRCRLHGIMPQHADAFVNAALKQWSVACCRRWMRQREEDGGGGWQEGMHALLLGGRGPLPLV
jgi:hypothetical protein